MGRFLNRLQVVQREDHRWVLLREMAYRADNGRLFRVPTGFDTDFASVPKPFRNLVPRWSKTTRPAVLHDFLYATQPPGVTRSVADDLFYEALLNSGVGGVGAWLMWLGVHLGGWWAWHEKRKTR